MQEGQAGSWLWRASETGKQTAAIGYRAGGDRVTLSYSIDGDPRKQVIQLTETDCNYGGARKWFTCPIRGERVAVLFLRAGRFACRHCQRIAYGSQSGDLCDRTWRKQAKVEAKLGPSWARPKGMHRATRERLMAIIWECEERREADLSRYLEMIMQRHPSLRNDPMLR